MAPEGKAGVEWIVLILAPRIRRRKGHTHPSPVTPGGKGQAPKPTGLLLLVTLKPACPKSCFQFLICTKQQGNFMKVHTFQWMSQCLLLDGTDGPPESTHTDCLRSAQMGFSASLSRVGGSCPSPQGLGMCFSLSFFFPITPTLEADFVINWIVRSCRLQKVLEGGKGKCESGTVAGSRGRAGWMGAAG